MRQDGTRRPGQVKIGAAGGYGPDSTASILQPGGKPVLPLVEVKARASEWFWVGGQSYQGGTLFIGIKVAP